MKKYVLKRVNLLGHLQFEQIKYGYNDCWRLLDDSIDVVEEKSSEYRRVAGTDLFEFARKGEIPQEYFEYGGIKEEYIGEILDPAIGYGKYAYFKADEGYVSFAFSAIPAGFDREKQKESIYIIVINNTKGRHYHVCESYEILDLPDELQKFDSYEVRNMIYHSGGRYLAIGFSLDQKGENIYKWFVYDESIRGEFLDTNFEDIYKKDNGNWEVVINPFGSQNASNENDTDEFKDIAISCHGNVTQKGLENVTLYIDTTISFKDNHFPPLFIPGYDPTKIKRKSNISIKMEDIIINGIACDCKAYLDSDGNVREMEIRIKRDVSNAVIESDYFLKFNQEQLRTITLDNAVNMKAIRECLEEIIENDSTIVYKPKNSSFSIKENQNRFFLLGQGEKLEKIIDDVTEPVYFETMPNGDIIVVQKNKNTVVLDSETKMPKAYISIDKDDEVSLTIVGEENDYVLRGKKDAKTNRISKLVGEVNGIIPVFVDDAKPVDLNGEESLSDIVRLSQERIAYYGGKPAIKGKKTSLK